MATASPSCSLRTVVVTTTAVASKPYTKEGQSGGAAGSTVTIRCGADSSGKLYRRKAILEVGSANWHSIHVSAP